MINEVVSVLHGVQVLHTHTELRSISHLLTVRIIDESTAFKF